MKPDMLKPLPRVSICLLTYNRARILPRSIESLLSQSHRDFELIINDNDSTDNTGEVCRSYERQDSRVRYFKNPKNLRYAGNQNAAMLRASCDYVALVHDGDLYRQDMIEKWTAALLEHPSAALVFNALEQRNERGEIVKDYRHGYGDLVRGMDLFDDMIRRPDSPIFGIVMVRKSYVMSAGPFDPRMPTLADVDMWLRLLLRYDAAYIAEPLICIAPREANHQVNDANWRLRQEYELIYTLNSSRRYPSDVRAIEKLRREIAPMLWKFRARALLYCLWHLRFGAFIQGLEYIGRRLNFATNAEPNSVIDWHDAERLLVESPSR